MKRLIKSEVMLNIPARWKLQYYDSWGDKWFDESKHATYINLIELKHPTENAIVGIIGNDSWTSIECDECENSVDSATIFNTYRETLQICDNCLKKALGEIES